MRTVRDMMRPEVEVLLGSESDAAAAGWLAGHDADTVALCGHDGTLTGSVSNRDIVTKVVAKGLDPAQVSLSEIADRDDVLAVDVDLPADDAVAVMCRHHRSRLPVTEGTRVIGLLVQRDLARTLALRPWTDS